MVEAKGKYQPSRVLAREQIIAAANKHRNVSLFASRMPYTMRHLQLCVAICRRRRLVKNRVLIAAGFKPYREREGRTIPLLAKLIDRRGEQQIESTNRRIRRKERNP